MIDKKMHALDSLKQLYKFIVTIVGTGNSYEIDKFGNVTAKPSEGGGSGSSAEDPYKDLEPEFLCLLISGGIDSPVAGYMIAKRGVSLCAVHFYSYPYTSERAKDKVLELAKIVGRYCGGVKVFVVPFTDIQLAIDEKCREELSTVIMRRSMMRIAERVARKSGCSALITGERVGQVASQTMQALYCTDSAADMPIFRPLIGMDKMEVVSNKDKGTKITLIKNF